MFFPTHSGSNQSWKNDGNGNIELKWITEQNSQRNDQSGCIGNTESRGTS
jgi:hypothetical protein